MGAVKKKAQAGDPETNPGDLLIYEGRADLTATWRVVSAGLPHPNCSRGWNKQSQGCLTSNRLLLLAAKWMDG